MHQTFTNIPFLIIILLGIYMAYYSLIKLIKTKSIKANGVQANGIIKEIVSKASILERRNYQPIITFMDTNGVTITGLAQNVIKTGLPIWNKVGQKVLVYYDKNSHFKFIIYTRGEFVKALLILLTGLCFICFSIANLA